MSAIVDFLEGRGPDGAGRMIEAVLAFGPAALERHHDFIQWLFPLPEPSRAVAGSPVLGAQDIRIIRRSAAAQQHLAQAQVLMSRFYLEGSDWLRMTDHNHLRITRIIRSLRLLVGDAAAEAFRETILRRVDAAGGPVSGVSRAYWLAA
jgi:hypothetical protein